MSLMRRAVARRSCGRSRRSCPSTRRWRGGTEAAWNHASRDALLLRPRLCDHDPRGSRGGAATHRHVNIRPRRPPRELAAADRKRGEADARALARDPVAFAAARRVAAGESSRAPAAGDGVAAARRLRAAQASVPEEFFLARAADFARAVHFVADLTIEADWPVLGRVIGFL